MPTPLVRKSEYASSFDTADTFVYMLRGDALARERDTIDASAEIVERCIHEPTERWIVDRMFGLMQTHKRWVGIDYVELYHEAEASNQQWIAFDAHREAIKHERLSYRARVERFSFWSLLAPITLLDPKLRRRKSWHVPIHVPHERTSHAEETFEPRYDYDWLRGGNAPRQVNAESFGQAVHSLGEHHLIHVEWAPFKEDSNEVRRGAIFPTLLLIQRLHIAQVFCDA